MKKILSIIFLTVIAIVLLTATLRGEFGNPESISELSRLNAETLPFESSHERAPYAEMLSIKNRGTIELGKELGLFASPDAGYDGEKIYSFFPSGVSYLILGGYIIGQNYNLGLLSAFAVMGLLTVGTIILIFLISRNIFKLPIWASILAPLTFAFATTSWSYSITIYQHAPTAFIAMLMFYLIWKYKNAKNGLIYVYALLVGSLYALALFIDYPNALTLSPIGAYFFISSFKTELLKNKVKATFKSAFFVMLVAFMIINILHLYRNQTIFGHWTKLANELPRYSFIDGKLTNQLTASKKTEPVKYSRPPILSALSEEETPDGLKTLTVGIDKGLFLFSPILILFLLSFWQYHKKAKIEFFFLFSFILSSMFVYSSWSDPWGGWAYGPRYLVPAMAAFSIFVAIGISKGSYGLIKRIGFYLLFIFSSAVALGGALTTNAIPPKIEADYLKIPFYNFMRAFELMGKDKTGNFIYNTYLRSSITLYEYFYIIWGSLLFIVLILLFVFPLFEKNNESNS